MFQILVLSIIYATLKNFISHINLHATNFGKREIQKIVILTICKALNFDFGEFVQFFKAENHQNQN